MVLEGFLTDAECDSLKNYAIELGVDLDSSRASVDTNSKKNLKTRSNTRVGGARCNREPAHWFKDDPLHPLAILFNAREKLAKVLQTSPLNQETYNFQRTAIRQEFKQHHDFSYHNVEFLFEEGPRTWTALTYLVHPNEFQGGATEFPYVNLAVKPNKGSLVLWPNAHDGTLIKDFRTIHAGAIVHSGAKYTFNQNFRRGLAREEQFQEQRDNEWPYIYGDMESAPIRQFASSW
eukprot:CAMPEP_0197526510 /NCGR_PEP_ID=MMETSP1318-20131121/17994_1 /TAXON_ID=552666 /ORGANISM="Partenskyella glossopodia, Strain RCC365" /LENGTH=233 /DNA_ID=CAMNT_0043080689 /DNA_START=283 /DNA_END=981 /DNA_ORIENTATION=-